MQLFNKNGTIYVKFRSHSKIISKSLKAAYNDTNLKYAQTTLLPIFQALYNANLCAQNFAQCQENLNAQTYANPSNSAKSQNLTQICKSAHNKSAKQNRAISASNPAKFSQNFAKCQLSENLNAQNHAISSNFAKSQNLAPLAQFLPHKQPPIRAKSNSRKPTHPRKTATSPKLSEIYAIMLSQNAFYVKQTTKYTAFYACKRIFDFICDQEITLYSPAQIHQAIAKMRQTLAPATIRLLLTYLNLAFNKAIHLNLLHTNPLKFIKKPPLSPRFKPILTNANIQNLLSHAQNFSRELQIFLYIAFYTGARSGEILALQTTDIDLENRLITISKNQTRFELTTPKNGKFRHIFIPQRLLNFLKTLNLNATNEKIFKSDYFRIYYFFKKLLKSLNLPPFGLHQTRHIFTTILMQNGISPTFIANALGHSSLKMVNQTYSHYILTHEQSQKVEIALNF